MNKNAGFTLIELLVVVLIIGILAAVALPQYQVAVEKSRYTQMQVGADMIEKGNQLYYMSTGSYTFNLNDLDLTLSGCKIADNGKSCKLESGAVCVIDDGTVGVAGTHVPVSYCVRNGLYYFSKLGNTPRVCGAITGNQLANQVCKSRGGVFLYEHMNGWNAYKLPG